MVTKINGLIPNVLTKSQSEFLRPKPVRPVTKVPHMLGTPEKNASAERDAQRTYALIKEDWQSLQLLLAGKGYLR